MVVGLMRKVKQPVLTAVCRARLFVQWEAALDPGGGAAVDVGDGWVAELLEVAGRGETSLAAVADGQDRPITGHFVDALLQLPQRDQLGAGHVTLPIFPRLPHVQQEGRWLVRQPSPELADIDAGNLDHGEILVAGRKLHPPPGVVFTA